MLVAITLVVWVAVGVAVGLFESRRGHWSKLAVLTAVLGPLAIPIAVNWHRRTHVAGPRTIERGTSGTGGLDVVVGIDGSPESIAAARAASAMLGSRLRRLTLAAVVDVETAEFSPDAEMYPDPWPEEQQARDHLVTAADEVERHAGLRPETVLLAGNPAHALESYVLDEGYDLLMVGRRGHGLSKLVFGSCASQLAQRGRVPVVLFGAPAEHHQSPNMAVKSRRG